jgi:hypothetical protein
MTGKEGVCVLTVVLLTAVSGAAQTVPDGWTAPHTADGHPDIQGVWANNQATPLERPAELADRSTLTDEEQAALAARALELFGGDGDAAFGDGVFNAVLADPEKYASSDGGTGNYNAFWVVERDFDNRTSLVVDPPSGRIPLTAETTSARAARNPGRRLSPAGPEEAGLSVRCISYGAPYLMAGYNSYFQILQTATHVAIVQEMIHDARIIPLTDRPHIHDDVDQWHGDSRGHWEGETLVVETTNYRGLEGMAPEFMTGGGTDKRRIVERFTRIGPEALSWAITFDDPETWTQPWTAEMVMSSTDQAIFEYACHEGNIGLHGVLAGTRQLEQSDTP